MQIITSYYTIRYVQQSLSPMNIEHRNAEHSVGDRQTVPQDSKNNFITLKFPLHDKWKRIKEKVLHSSRHFFTYTLKKSWGHLETTQWQTHTTLTGNDCTYSALWSSDQ